MKGVLNMRNFIAALSFLAVMAGIAIAQGSDDYKKVEVYVGYSNGQVDSGLDSGNSAVDFFRDRESFHGFNVSGVYNVSRYIGIKGDFSGTYNSTRFTGGFDVGLPYTVSVKNDNSLYNFLGGVQLKDNSRSGRFKPFAHALAGGAHVRTKISDYTCTPTAVCPIPTFPDQSFGETGFAGAFGGGLDIRLNNKVQIRAFQADYNPLRVSGFTQHNVRFGAGIVF